VIFQCVLAWIELALTSKPELAAFGELLRKIREDVREDFASASLRTHDSRNRCEWIRLRQRNVAAEVRD
jgi:hypothetical protein